MECQHFRGGATGASATGRKRVEKLLTGLAELLKGFGDTDGDEKARSPERTTGPTKPTAKKEDEAGELLRQLKGIIQRAEKTGTGNLDNDLKVLIKKFTTGGTTTGGTGSSHVAQPKRWADVVAARNDTTRTRSRLAARNSSGAKLRHSDWDGADFCTTTYDDLIDWVESKGKGKIALLHSGEDDELQDLASALRGNDQVYLTLVQVLTEGAAPGALEGRNETDAMDAKIPVEIDGRLVLKKGEDHTLQQPRAENAPAQQGREHWESSHRKHGRHHQAPLHGLPRPPERVEGGPEGAREVGPTVGMRF